MNSSRFRFVLASAVGLMLFLPVGGAQAQESTPPEFTVAPPPLAYPDYGESGSLQGRVTGAVVRTKSEGFELTGEGVSVTTRYVLDPSGDLGRGLGFAGGVVLYKGDGSGFDLDGYELTLLGNYEAELLKSDGYNLIGFLGPNFIRQHTNLSAPGFIEVVVNATLYGYQAGAQMSFYGDSAVISPFVMYQSASGKAKIDINLSAIPALGLPASTASDEQNLDVTVTVYGFDLLHIDSGITLSGVLQAASSDEQNAKTTLIQLSYAFGASGSTKSPGESQSGSSARAF